MNITEQQQIGNAAEIACIENVNRSAEHNKKLQNLVDRFVAHTPAYQYSINFPFDSDCWRGMRKSGVWGELLATINGIRAPEDYYGITNAAAARCVIEHFSSKPIFAKEKVSTATDEQDAYNKTIFDKYSKKAPTQFGVDWGSVDTTTTGRVTLMPGDTISVTLLPPGVTITKDMQNQILNNAFTTNHNTIKEKAMSTKAIKVTNVTFVQVDGSTRVDIKDLSLETAVDLIKQSENAILEFGKLKAQPKAVTKRIEELQAGIDALVLMLDNREV